MNCFRVSAIHYIIFYETNLFVAMTLQKVLHVMRIGVENASAIAFVSSNSCCRSDDAAATILVEVCRCVAAAAAYAAVVIVGATAGAIVEWHSNNGAITQARI